MSSSNDAKDQRQALITWGVVVVLSVLSWLLGAELGLDAIGGIITVLVVVVAFVKMWLIGYSFMEVRRGSVWLRGALIGWCVLTCVLILAFFLAE